MPDLYQKAGIDDDSTWRKWADTSDCEKNFPSDKRLTSFQQILIIQALRPDRLQIAMRDFACRVLNLKDISPSSTNIRVIYEHESTAAEPILFIVSPGSDPSEELKELAESVVGKQSYHEVGVPTASGHRVGGKELNTQSPFSRSQWVKVKWRSRWTCSRSAASTATGCA